jgi:hypothetical protein
MGILLVLFTLTWIAPTANTDGTAITSPLTYRLYSGPKGAEVYRRTVTGTQATVTDKKCFTLIAVENGVQSLPSNEACLKP